MCASYGLDPRIEDYKKWQRLVDDEVLAEIRRWAAENAKQTLRPTGPRARNFNPIVREGRLELGWWSFNRAPGVNPKLNTINAKSERLLESRTWREPFRSRRALIPATEWYEYQNPDKTRFALASDEPYMIAGITAAAEVEEGPISCYSMVMQPAPEHLLHVHDRMPMLIGPELAADWLDPGTVGDEQFRAAVIAASAEIGRTVTARLRPPKTG